MGKLISSKQLLDLCILNSKILTAEMAGRKSTRDLLLKTGTRMARTQETEPSRQQQRAPEPTRWALEQERAIEWRRQAAAERPAQAAERPAQAVERPAQAVERPPQAEVRPPQAEERPPQPEEQAEEQPSQAELLKTRLAEHKARLELAASLRHVGLPGRKAAKEFEDENIDPRTPFRHQAAEILHKRVYERVDQRRKRKSLGENGALRHFLLNQEVLREYEDSLPCHIKRKHLE